MINNYLEYEYKPSHRVYSHDESQYGIYIGDISAALDEDFIRKEPIRTVVTAALGLDHVSYTSQINHIVYPLMDMKSQNITKFFNDFYDLIDRQLFKGNILIHCAAGISRSTTLVLSYLMKKKNWTFKQAIKFVRETRPTVCPNLGFERQLKQYQSMLKKIPSSSKCNRRFESKTSQSRKHIYSPFKFNAKLPQIGILGLTQRKCKILEPTNFQSNELASNNSHQFQLKTNKKQKQKKQAQSNLILNNFPQSNIRSTSNNDGSQLRKNINFSHFNQPIQRIQQQVVITKLKLNEKKNFTQKVIRTKPLQKFAY